MSAKDRRTGVPPVHGARARAPAPFVTPASSPAGANEFAPGTGETPVLRTAGETPAPRTPFAEPAQAERCYRLGAPEDPRPDAPPLWRQITRFTLGRAASLTQSRAGLARLVAWVTHWLGAVAHDRDGLPCDPDWEPSRELAGVLGCSEAHLNRLCREHGGASAREIWDRLRLSGFAKALRAEIERMLDGWAFVRPKGQEYDPFQLAQTALRAARREAGWTRLGFAWRKGFRHHARLNLAAFRELNKTVQEVEAEALMNVAKTWHYDLYKCIISREQPKPNQNNQVDNERQFDEAKQALSKSHRTKPLQGGRSL